MDGAEGAGKLLRVTIYYRIDSGVNQSHFLLLIYGGLGYSELNMKPPIISNSPHLKAILARILHLRHGRTIPQIGLYP